MIFFFFFLLSYTCRSLTLSLITPSSVFKAPLSYLTTHLFSFFFLFFYYFITILKTFALSIYHHHSTVYPSLLFQQCLSYFNFFFLFSNSFLFGSICLSKKCPFSLNSFYHFYRFSFFSFLFLLRGEGDDLQFCDLSFYA